MAQCDLSDKIDRLDALEERAGVSLHGLSAFLQEAGTGSVVLNVGGELRSRDGSQLQHDVTLVIAVYDSAGRVVETLPYTYYSNDFFELETFSFAIDLPVRDVAKIRVYPKRGE